MERNDYYLPSIPCMQYQPPFNSYLWNTGQAKQLQPLSSISAAGFSEAPRAQNSACGLTALRALGLNVGQGPQNFLQISMFSGVSGTFCTILKHLAKFQAETSGISVFKGTLGNLYGVYPICNMMARINLLFASLARERWFRMRTPR